MPRSSESLEREKVESGTGMNEFSHGPAQSSQGDQFNCVGKDDDGAEYGGGDCVVNGSELPRDRPDDCLVGQSSTETVVPQAGCSDRGAIGAKCRGLVAQQKA